MDSSVDKTVGERLATVVEHFDLSATEISRRLGAEYTALSHFHRGRRSRLPRPVTVEQYVALLEELTGKTADELGIADLARGAAA